ncbi:MAG: hypothetical protein QXO27_04325 [Candidatus Aenigmatarchaeota archaeon]
MERDVVINKFLEFLQDNYQSELAKVVGEGKKSVEIDFSLLDKFDIELADYILESPEEVIPILEEALNQIDTGLADFKPRIRFFNLPENREVRIRNIRVEHMGKLIVVDGIVKRASEIRPEVSETVFECVECGARITLIQTEKFIHTPTECDSPSCRSRRFKLVNQKLYDARWLTVEEPFEIVTSERPSELMIYLKEDLTSQKMQNKTDPGNRIKVVGILKQLPRRVKGSRSRQLEIYLDANYVESIETEWEELEISPEDEAKILELAKDPMIYKKLVDSIAPALYGLDHIKEAISLQLFGGELHIQKDKSKVRGDIHILLVGDPSTAKSALMKVVSTLIPRGRYVSGKGVSVDYDDPIIYRENGVIKTGLIGDFVDKFYQTNRTGLVNVSNREVPAFNFKDFKIEWKPVRYVYRHEIDEPLIKLTLRTNRTVKVTSSHSVYSIENGIVKEKKASEIKEGDFILIPRRLPQNEKQIVKINLLDELHKLPEDERKNIIVENGFLKSRFSSHKIPVEIPVDENLMRLLGYYTAEGSLHETKGDTRKVGFYFGSNENEIIEDVKDIVKSVFNVDIKVNPKPESNAYDVTINDKIVFLIFKYILNVEKSTKRKKVPEIVFNSSPKAQLEFIRGWVKGDHGVTVSQELMSDIQYLLLLNGIVASFSERNVKDKIKFPDHESHVDTKVYELKSPKVTKVLRNIFNMSRIHGYPPIETFKSEKILNLIKNKYKRVSKSALEMLFSPYNSLLYERLEMISRNVEVNELSKVYKINKKSVSQYLDSLVKKGFVIKLNKENRIKYIISDKGRILLNEIRLIKSLASSDLGFVEVKTVERVEPTKNFVYDLSVESLENFVAGFGGVICHNTGAGLTATVVKDEEFLGGWVLEAGALVMCNRSLLAIDEFEKIEKTDQVALHEALEQQTISIAKASIMATLPAQTAIIGGGNPKLGRFDPYIPIKEQIDVPETILSRFDLKFALRDIPNPEEDTRIADHILKSRHYKEEEMISPVIQPDLIKKYIAYARKNCHPKLSREAGEVLKNFFVELRSKSAGGESPIPITLRQYEALIRLAEASAKVQLRNEVTTEDALRAINLMKASLREFGFEPETGMYDIDRAEGQKVTATQRSKIRIILDVIDGLTLHYGKEIPQQDIINKAKEQGVDAPDDILKKMLSEGIIFSPKPGFISKV